MTPKDVLIAVQLARPRHATEVLEGSEKCLMLFAPLVEKTPRCLFSHVTIARYIAVSAISRIRLVAALGSAL